MTMRVRTGLLLIVALGMMGLASCDHYVCTSGAQFGASSCTAGAPGLGGTGGTGSATAAFAFAVDTAGTIDGYTLNTVANTFQATPGYTAPVVPPNNGGIGMVVAQKEFVYAAFGGVGQIYGWTVGSTGTLTSISSSPFSAAFLANFPIPVGEAEMITNPAGTMLFVSDPNQDLIYTFTIGAGGVLGEPGTTVAVPFPPTNLATDGEGKYLYAVDGNLSAHTGSEIAAYVIGSNGTLTAVPGSPFTGANYQMWLLKGEPTGQFLIGTSGNATGVSGTDDDHLYVFSITQSGANAGAITPVSGSPFATAFSPFSIAVSPDTAGNLVYSFSFNDTIPPSAFNGVEGYTISSTGTLTKLSGSPFTNVAEGSWGQFDQSGAFLFVWSSFFNQSTGAEVTQLGPDEVGSGGALTQPIPTLTLASEAFWVVTDPQ